MPSRKPLVLSLIGARPQFIKIAPRAGELAKKFRHVIIHTGQHYDRMMSDIFFDQLKIPRADYNLLVGSGRHAEMTGKIMMRLEKKLLQLRPDMMLVYGDTNSTLAGALTAVKLHIPVAHVEAGLRSYRLDMPEEVNRVLADHISSLLFCPTIRAIQNLKKEGMTRGLVHSGDLMYELIKLYEKKIETNSSIISRLGIEKRNYILLTLHRAGNVDDREALEKGIESVGKVNIPIVFPVHPRTEKNLRKFRLIGLLNRATHIRKVPPLSYLDNLSLIRHARAVMTDSGGMQKEAIFLGTPCLTMRDETEWTETLNQGNFLVGFSYSRIERRLNNLPILRKSLSCKLANRKPSEIISSAISRYLKVS